MRRVVLDDRQRQGLVFGLIVVGVVLALMCVNTERELVRRRQETCDAALALPTAAYVVGAIGLVVGVLALVLLMRWFGRSREAIVVVLFATAVAGVVSELFTLIMAIQEGRPASPACGS